ncbi:Beta-ketoacyl synthase [Desulfonatronospira thiodismutans ASO3-1]|uniref:Beta-ketoacyl synthase n=1 Tax=Desulfonatronospira thiodismutans ASO3-1 TaxID=555779 RepID=D6SS19_9BACT|nr:Beta-ketoacyl synthase [Desulfonatronospira thiodismutans ASO3-1]
MPVYIRGIGVLGSFGTGVHDLRKALEEDRAAETSFTSHDLDNAQKDLPVATADTGALGRYLPRKVLRRIDHYSRMAVLGSFLALEDAGMLDNPRERMGIVIATSYGAAATTFSFLDSVINDGDACASPTYFSNSVHNAAAAHISILLNITGPSLTVSQFELSVSSGLITARQWLLENRVDYVLFGAVDEYCALRGYSWLRLCVPGSKDISGNLAGDDQGSVMGEGAAFFLLSSEKTVDDYGCITDIQQGRWHECSLSFSGPAPLILNSGSELACKSNADLIPGQSSQGAAHAHIFGGLPASQAFDLAVAGLKIQQGQLFPCSEEPGTSIAENCMQQDPGIVCLQIGKGGDFGAVTLVD